MPTTNRQTRAARVGLSEGPPDENGGHEENQEVEKYPHSGSQVVLLEDPNDSDYVDESNGPTLSQNNTGMTNYNPTTPIAPRHRRVQRIRTSPVTMTRRVGRPKTRVETVDQTNSKTGTNSDNTLALVLQAIRELQDEAQKREEKHHQILAIHVTEGIELSKTITTLQDQLKAMREEVTELKETIKEMSKIVSTSQYSPSARGSQSLDWPALPASQNDSQVSLKPASQGSAHEMMVVHKERTVTVLLGKDGSKIVGQSLNQLKAIASKELLQEPTTKTVQVISVIKQGKNSIDILTASKEQADIAQANKRWVRGFGEHAKVKEATWYPVKVDGVQIDVLCSLENNKWQFKGDVLDIINEGNVEKGIEVKAKNIYWLRQPKPDAVNGSIVVSFDSYAVAEQLVKEQLILFGGSHATVRPFIKQPQPNRCFKCNQYGHHQNKCPAASPKCGKCADPHFTWNCKGTKPDKCGACHGNHRATEAVCPLYQEERRKMAQLEGRSQRSSWI